MSRVIINRPGSDPPRASFVRWVGSLLGLIGLLLVVPLVFIAFGVLPPIVHLGHLLARPGLVVHHLNRPLSDSTIDDSVALAAWVAWLWLVLCVAVEIAAAIRGRPTFRLPASRHVQSLVTTLLGASLAIFPIGRSGLPMRLLAAPAGVHRVVGIAAAATESRISDGTGSAPRGRATFPAGEALVASVEEAVSSPSSGTSYTVRRGDTLWSIAENELGSPLRWREIADLNYGRIQSDGEALTNAHWIFPGWELLLPTGGLLPSSTSVAQVPASTTSFRPTKVSPASVGAPRSMVAPASLGAPAEVRIRPSDLSILSDPLALAGQGSKGDLHDTWTSADPTTPPTGARSPVDPTERSPLPVGEIGYGILGAGVLALLERLRRVQRRHRPGGLRIALPQGDLVALERRLRTESDPEGADFVDLGLRALVLYTLRQEMTPPLATLYRLSNRSFEVMLDLGSESRTPPEPFSAYGEPTRWLLARDPATIEGLSQDPALRALDPPFPALVTVGRDMSGLVFVDLEQAASLAVSGSGAKAILAAIAVEMATAGWADPVELTLVGFDGELDSLERVIHVAAIADVVSKAQRRVRERRALLASINRQANWEIRWAEGGDAWDLSLIICSSTAVTADPEGAAALVEMAGARGHGLAVVMGSEVGTARWHLSGHAGQIALEMNGHVASVMSGPSFEAELSADIGSLLEVASRLEGVPPTDPPYDELAEPEPTPAPNRETEGQRPVETVPGEEIDGDSRVDRLSPRSVEAPEVDVRVLGPIEIEGAARPFTRAWAIELIVYLALHPKGATSEQWATALWPDRIMAPASLHSTASAARRSLGVSTSGDDHLPRAHGRLSLGATVANDWGRFSDFSKTSDPANWRRALLLIRGRPFDGLRAADWVLLEGIAANVEAVVVDLAVRYAEHCLSAGDANEAEWAARRGLQVSAYDERLYRVLLRSADLSGNPAGVESVMAELVHLVAEDVEPYDAVHPETYELYRALSRRSSASLRR